MIKQYENNHDNVEKEGYNIMFNTVFLGGFGMLLLIGAMVVSFVKLEKTDLSNGTKRVIHAAMAISMITITAFVINWHKTVWMAQFDL
jgi:hypothetical protein